MLIKIALLFDLCLPLCLSEGFDYFEPQDVYRLLSEVVCRDIAPYAVCVLVVLGLSCVWPIWALFRVDPSYKKIPSQADSKYLVLRHVYCSNLYNLPWPDKIDLLQFYVTSNLFR